MRVYLYNRTFISVAVTEGTTADELMDLLVPKIAAKSHPIERLALYAVENDVGTSAL